MPPPPPASPGSAASGMPPAPPADQTANGSSDQGYTPYPNGSGQAQNEPSQAPYNTPQGGPDYGGQAPAYGGQAPPYYGGQAPPPYGGQAPPPYGGNEANGGWGPRGNAHVPGGQTNLLAVSPQAQNASGPVTIPPGTLLTVRTTQPLNVSNLKSGDSFQVTAAADVYENGVVAIPRGTVLTGQVLDAKKAGAFAGSAHLDLKLTALQMGPTTYPVASDDWDSRSPSKTGYTAANTAGGAIFGALIGAIAGGGVGAGVGAIAGGATGAAVSGATRNPGLILPPEAALQFHITEPLTVQPLKFSEAQQIAASAPRQPVLQRRYYPAPPPYPYYGRPYAYPPAY